MVRLLVLGELLEVGGVDGVRSKDKRAVVVMEVAAVVVADQLAAGSTE
jgi:hypothetical protein